MSGAGTARTAYLRLFTAHAIGLLATGVATVALALLAFDLAEDHAGAVLGTALAIKMATNIVVTPLAAALAAGPPRRLWFPFLAVVRAGALVALPFVDAVWQVYVLIAVFQVAAAAAAAAYLVAVPSLLPDPDEYAAAVGKSRIAYEAETLLSPLVTAVLLIVLAPRLVFVVAMVLFLLSAVIALGVSLPSGGRSEGHLLRRLGGDFRRLLGEPAVRASLLLNAGAIIVSAMVTVNTVVLVRALFDYDDIAVAVALAAYGAGGIVAALMLPRLIRKQGERQIMLRAGVAMAALLAAGAALPGYWSMLALWAGLGVTSALAQLPVSTLIRRMSHTEERAGLYAAQYALSHMLLLLAYLAAGWVGAEAGLIEAFLGLGLLSLALVSASAALWPREATLKGAGSHGSTGPENHASG